ncbi:MAG: DegV family protein [Candidatus Dojkabacteria bacterium]|nr:DegV family protein [Candidatus Dojkabacteria bacterium]
MSKVKIITERISSLSFDFAKNHGIHLIPANVVYKGKTEKEDTDEKCDEFIHQLASLDEMPKTAVISPAEMRQHFLEATKDTDKAIYIGASSKLSSFYSLGKQTAEKLKDEGKDIRAFDSQVLVSLEGLLAYESNQLAQEGKSIDDILDFLRNVRENRLVDEYGVIGTLKYLEKGGRIGKAKAWLGSLLSFKPVITHMGGTLEPITKVRTYSQGLNVIVRKISEQIDRVKPSKIKVMYDYGSTREIIESEFAPVIEKEFNPEVISYNQMSMTVASHFGPEVIGVAFYMEK